VDATWLDTEVLDAGFATGPGDAFVEGERLLRRPEWTFSGSLRYRLSSGVDLTASVRRVGERADRDFTTYPATPVVLDAYTTLNLGGEVELWAPGAGRPGLVLTLRGENLMDRRYEEVLGFPAPGRGLYLGGRMSFGDR
jgi:vitamin B12 transporter